ncbi:MAG: ATP-binding protein [Clostridia bacterium]|nr:ATP-binding protein [Clostridia bacterium]
MIVISNEILNNILKEYEQKKTKAELDAIERKEKLYNSVPQLQKIEDELNKFAIQTTKNILNGNKDEINLLNEKINKLKNEKIQILKSKGIDLGYLKPFYECSKCNDTGYITTENNKKEMCNCLKQKLLNISFNNSNLSNLDKENFKKFNELMYSDEVDIAKYKYNISPRKNILNIKEKAIEFIDNFDNPDYKNLLFTGNSGLGKTYMTNCIAAEMLKKGKTVLYQTAPVLLENVINYKMSKNKDNLFNFYNSVLESDLLIIDDLGTESQNSMKLSELFTIINTRLLNSNNKITKTIISTNLGIKEIFNFYEERIGSRIAGYYDIYYFFGDDIRFKLNK